MTAPALDHPSRRSAAMLVALCTIAIGVIGILYPEAGMALRRSYFATPGRFFAAGAVRVVMGLVLIIAASSSRWPNALRALGAAMCLQALSATVMGADHARTILEWEGTRPTLLRAGAFVALGCGCFMAYAVARSPAGKRRA